MMQITGLGTFQVLSHLIFTCLKQVLLSPISQGFQAYQGLSNLIKIKEQVDSKI